MPSKLSLIEHEIKLVVTTICLILNYNFFPIIGDEFDDEEMLDWLTDPNIMEVSDQIEKVNRKMFEKLTKRNDHMAVFFCKFNI